MDRVEPNPQIREILVAVQAVLRDAYASGKYGEWRVAGTFEPQTFGRTKGGCEFSRSGRGRWRCGSDAGCMWGSWASS